MSNKRLISIVDMWYKVNNLSRKKLSQAQIASKLNVHRSTVKRYQSMTEDEFNEMLHREANRHTCKLDGYRSFIVNELHDAPFLSSAQIMDHLKETFPDIPAVSEKTVYNYVMRVRREENLPKDKEPVRQMLKIPDCAYGEQAQVDYGEKWIETYNGHRVKIYLIAFVMCRSRYRFFYLQNTPFTAESTVYAHHLAFKYFGGMPRQMLYDQDRKLLVSENFGDYLMTECFAGYVKKAGFECVFMRAADPQSKGKVENLVKYIKQNFLAGRRYDNIVLLNEQALGWLERTGNGKVHATTKQIPSEEFKEEQKHLQPYTLEMDEPQQDLRYYVVRSDNTILYRSNIYGLPLNTYRGKDTKVGVRYEMDSNKLYIYHELTGDLITDYTVSPLKGQFFTKDGFANRGVSRSVKEMEEILRNHLGPQEGLMLASYLNSLNDLRPRYYLSNVTAMASLLTEYDRTTAVKLLHIFIEKKVNTGSKMKEIAHTLYSREAEEPEANTRSVTMGPRYNNPDLTPERSDMSTYANIIKA